MRGGRKKGRRGKMVVMGEEVRGGNGKRGESERK